MDFNTRKLARSWDLTLTRKRSIMILSAVALISYIFGFSTYIERYRESLFGPQLKFEPAVKSNLHDMQVKTLLGIESVTSHDAIERENMMRSETPFIVASSNVRESIKPVLYDVLTRAQFVPGEVSDWSPYMDVLDEEEALSDPPLEDIKQSVSVELSKVYIRGRKKRYDVGDTVDVQIELYDAYGNRRKRGGDQLQVRIFEDTLNASACGYLIDHNNGSYTAKVKCLWSGEPTILVHLMYTREAIRALYYVRRALPTLRPIDAIYGNNETQRCHAFAKHLDQSKGLCNMTSKNDGMSWFCEAPTSKVTCDSVRLFDLNYPFPDMPVTKAEDRLFKRNGERLIPALDIVVREKANVQRALDKPKCALFNRTKLWFQASPIGHYMHNKWEPEHCKLIPTGRFKSCLKNKHLLLYGDSTVRQWFSNLVTRLGCELTTEEWTQEKWKENSAAYCSGTNFTIEWIAHEFPGNIRNGRSAVNSVAGNMLKFAENKNAIFLIHFLCHLSSYHHDVFRDRISRVRMIAETILKANKDAKILIKGGHTFRDRRRLSDYYTYVYRIIMIEEFKGLYDKVIYLDNRDMTMARDAIFCHPDDLVVTEMVNQMMSYICN